MKAAVFKRENLLAVEEVPVPPLGRDEVLIRVKYCAICGSDLHRYAFGMLKPGAIMGHEYVGTVVEMGKEVKGFAVGDRVTRWGGRITPGRDLPNFPPRFSAKERGLLEKRSGAYAEFMAVKSENLCRVPTEVSDLEIALLEPLVVTVHASRLSNLRLGDQAVVLGAGPIGLFAVQCATLSGALAVYVSELDPVRREAALQLGAREAFDPNAVDLVKEIVKRTEIGADVAFECAGAKPTLQQALELVRMGGRVMVVSLAWEQCDCLPVEWVGREVELKACYSHLNSDWAIGLCLMQEKKVQVTPLISKIVPLEQIQEAFQELLWPGSGIIQTVVACS